MKPVECPREEDVLAAVCTGQWPERAAADLRAHVATCAICADVAVVASAMEDESASAPSDARLPDSGRVWWRAQLRARDEAVRAAVRPITAVQALAFTCAVGLAGALFGATSAWFQSGLRWLLGAISVADPRDITVSGALGSMVAQHELLVLVMASFVILAPVAVYLVVHDD